MIAGALLYCQFHSWRNRLWVRIRRLRQPKYLFGAIVGALYVYFYFVRGVMGQGRRGAVPAAALALPPEVKDLPVTLGAVAFMIMLLLAWILPHSRTALAFSEAEISFLFPAPISRKMLLHFKLLKSQLTILFSALLITLIGRGWGAGHFVTRLLGWWVGMSVLNLHLLGSSFALTMLMDRGFSTWKRRALVLGAVGAVAAGLFIWARQSLPAWPTPSSGGGIKWIFDYIAQVFQSGPMPYVLAPFRLVVAPYFAPGYRQFLVAFGPALAIAGLHYVWVMHSNVAFEEASVELSRKLAERVAAVRSGQWQNARPPKKAARAPFVLRPSGPPAVAVLWKNLISAGQYVTARVWVMLAFMAIPCGVILTQSMHHSGGAAVGVLFLVGMLLAMSLFSGPQILRNDLRQDLPAADVLKMLPMPGWQIVLGEVLAPAAILTGFQWLLLLFGALVCPARISSHTVVSMGLRLSVVVAAAVVLPFIDLVWILIPNALVLFFPAWFQLGKDAPRGFETIGQQLILMFGQVLVVVLALAPPGGVFALCCFGGTVIRLPLVGVVMGAFGAAIFLAIEAAIGVTVLGRVFERFDLSGEVL